MKSTLRALITRTIAVLLVFTAGCTYIAPREPGQDLVPIKTIGVLPAQSAGQLSPESKNMAALETGAETIDTLLANYFQGYRDVNLISQTELQGLSFATTNKPFYLAREAGEKLHYDAVLISTITRYQERDGSQYGVTNPASVAFSLKLLAVDSGRVIWSSDFDQTQQPLLENILPKTRSTGSGFLWLTAAELTSAGLTKKLNSCPYLKRN